MKRFLIFMIVLIMLGGTMTAIWADIRTRNVNKKWGSCSSSESDGPLSADGSITVDVDAPGEGENLIDQVKSRIETILKGYGIQYEASASVSGTAPNDGYEGTSEVYAWVPNDEDHKQSERWQGTVARSASVSDRQTLPKNHNWGDVHANNELSSCTAWGDVDGSSPEKGEWVLVEGPSEALGSQIAHWFEWRLEQEALSHSAYGNAWNFSDPAQHNDEHN